MAEGTKTRNAERGMANAEWGTKGEWGGEKDEHLPFYVLLSTVNREP